jgi:hypothetical protein
MSPVAKVKKEEYDTRPVGYQGTLNGKKVRLFLLREKAR